MKNRNEISLTHLNIILTTTTSGIELSCLTLIRAGKELRFAGSQQVITKHSRKDIGGHSRKLFDIGTGVNPEVSLRVSLRVTKVSNCLVRHHMKLGLVRETSELSRQKGYCSSKTGREILELRRIVFQYLPEVLLNDLLIPKTRHRDVVLLKSTIIYITRLGPCLLITFGKHLSQYRDYFSLATIINR